MALAHFSLTAKLNLGKLMAAMEGFDLRTGAINNNTLKNG